MLELEKATERRKEREGHVFVGKEREVREGNARMLDSEVRFRLGKAVAWKLLKYNGAKTEVEAKEVQKNIKSKLLRRGKERGEGVKMC